MLIFMSADTISYVPILINILGSYARLHNSDSEPDTSEDTTSLSVSNLLHCSYYYYNYFFLDNCNFL